MLARHQSFFPPATERKVILPPLVPVSGSPGEPPAALRRLGYIGALTESKGLRILLAAAPALLAQGVTVAVAGGGPLQAQVESQPQIDYAGRLEGEAIPRFLASCDAGVVPSVWEEPGLTFAALEWLAARRPVISSGRGGLAELEPGHGVVTFDGTPTGLNATAADLRAVRTWERVSAEVPVVCDRDDLERWIDDHLRVYGLAQTRGLTST